MKGVVILVIAIVFVTSVKAVPIEPKQVNLALETVLRFDRKDRDADLAVIDKVQNVLEKIKNALQSRNGRKSNTGLTFTDFVLEAAKILRKYDDDDLEDAYAIIDDESRRYINKESKLRDLFGNDFRRYINDQLDIVRDMPAETLRQHLDTAVTALENNEVNEDNNDVLKIGNTLYVGQGDKFNIVLKKLDKLRRSNVVSLSQVLRDTLKSLIFDHYSNLNDNVKRELINIVRHYWRAFENDSKVSKDDDLANMVKKVRTSSVTPIHNTISSRDFELNFSPGIANRYKLGKLNPSVVNDRDYRSNKIKEEKQTTKWKSSKASFKLHYSMGSSSEESSDESKEGDEKKNSVEKKESESDETEPSDKSELLTGGQRNMRLRVYTSSENSAEQSDERHIPKPGQIVIQHSNVIDVGLSRKTPGRINVSFVSDERSKSRRNDVFESGRRQFTVFPATISHEGISIESFEKEDIREWKSMRKSNPSNASVSELNPKDPANVEKLIEDIEKQIEEVKVKVEYVKNLKIGANDTEIESRNIIFKAVHSDESVSIKSVESKNKTRKSPNSASIEKKNEEFLSADSIEKETTSKENTKTTSMHNFRYLYTSIPRDDDNDHSSQDKEIKQNDSKEPTKSTKITGTVNNDNNATENIEDIKLNLNETTNDNKIAIDEPSSENKEVNDKDSKNVTNVDEKNNLIDSTTDSNTNTTLNLDLSTKNIHDAIFDEGSATDAANLFL